jgi:hypothetical protein
MFIASWSSPVVLSSSFTQAQGMTIESFLGTVSLRFLFAFTLHLLYCPPLQLEMQKAAGIATDRL